MRNSLKQATPDLKARFPASTTVTFLTLLFARRLQADFLAKTASTGLSPSQANALRELSSEPHLSQRRLAELLEIGKARTGETVEKLARRGFIRRARSPSDRRAFVLSLTSKGRRALVDLEAAAAAQIDVITRKMGEKEVAELVRLLDRANDALGGPLVSTLE